MIGSHEATERGKNLFHLSFSFSLFRSVLPCFLPKTEYGFVNTHMTSELKASTFWYLQDKPSPPKVTELNFYTPGWNCFGFLITSCHLSGCVRCAVIAGDPTKSCM
jgi:hypothetical protein